MISTTGAEVWGLMISIGMCVWVAYLAWHYRREPERSPAQQTEYESNMAWLEAKRDFSNGITAPVYGRFGRR